MKHIIKRIISFGIIFSILLSAGCGGTARLQEGSGGPEGLGVQEDGSGNTADKQGDDEKAMGRYVETKIDMLEDSLSRDADLVRMEDGSLIFFDNKNGKYVSKDNGETWEQETLAWFEDIRTNTPVMDVAVSPDGYVGIIYEAEGEGDGSSLPEERETAEEPEAEEEGEELNTDIDYETHPLYRIIAPDGTALDFEIPYEDSGYLLSMRFSDEGRLFGAALSGEIYEIKKEDGSYERIAELSDWVYDMRIAGSRMACVSRDGITIIDLETKEIVEDKTLDEFVKSELGASLEPNTVYAVPAVVMLEEDVLCLVAEKGIYRHVIGGNLVEQLVDGSLTMLGNPSYKLRNAVKLPDDSFLVHFAGGKMMRYTYNPDVSTVPDIQLKAYSLKENSLLKQVISSYQMMNPEVYVKYEIGMEENSSVTREDALKKLNTEIMAGKGPDLLLLDDMPMDSYADKGILMDLSPYLSKLSSEEYFRNILETFGTDQGVYALPVQFKLPLIAGQEDRIRGLNGLKAIADEVEDMRKGKPEGGIFGAMTEEQLLEKLIPVSASAWKKNTKEIDEAALKDFFTEAVRIWNAEKQGITDEMQEAYSRMIEDYEKSGMTDAEIREYSLSLTGQILQYLVDKQELVAGLLGDYFDFSNIISTFRIKGKTDSIFAPYSGQDENIYIPQTVAGISSKSAYQKEAGELLELMLTDEAGTWSAFPVNKALWRESLTNPYPEEESFGYMGVEEEDGTTLSLEIFWPTEEEIDALYKIAEEASAPYIRDSVLEAAVRDTGMRILGGGLSIEEGVAEIKKKLAIYMAE